MQQKLFFQVDRIGGVQGAPGWYGRHPKYHQGGIHFQAAHGGSQTKSLPCFLQYSRIRTVDSLPWDAPESCQHPA